MTISLKNNNNKKKVAVEAKKPQGTFCRQVPPKLMGCKLFLQGRRLVRFGAENLSKLLSTNFLAAAGANGRDFPSLLECGARQDLVTSGGRKSFLTEFPPRREPRVTSGRRGSEAKEGERKRPNTRPPLSLAYLKAVVCHIFKLGVNIRVNDPCISNKNRGWSNDGPHLSGWKMWHWYLRHWKRLLVEP